MTDARETRMTEDTREIQEDGRQLEMVDDARETRGSILHRSAYVDRYGLVAIADAKRKS